MPSLGPLEIVMIFVVALLVFGPQKLPELGRQIGKAMREFQRVQDQFQSEVRSAFDTSDTRPAYPPPRPSSSVPPPSVPPGSPAIEAAPPPAGERPLGHFERDVAGREDPPPPPEPEPESRSSRDDEV